MWQLIKFILVSLLLLFIASPKVNAQNYQNSFVTIVNPVRISTYTKDPALSIRAEYEEIKKKDFSATWLLTYDAIANKSLSEVFSLMDERQEFGIFLEVTEKFSNNSGVVYNKTNSWHYANALFLSGYRQEDRKKLIDTVFNEFKGKFGYYPKSVGGWWVDAFSLSYMQEKYDITGVLGISDQFDLDGYQVWGTPFSIPFYSNKIHPGIPAESVSNKSGIVTFRWAARDPLNGYISPSEKQASLYSIQDYPQVGASNEYFEKLVELYSVKSEYNEFAHLTIGLEADYSPDTYEAIFTKRLGSVKKFESQGVHVLTMQEFSNWYRKEFTKTPTHFIETDDLLGKSKKVMWYQSSFYRMGLVYDYSSKKIQIIDLRPYLNNFQEPFYISPNKQFNLSINLPYVIDSVNDKSSALELNLGKFESISSEGENIKIQFDKGSVIFKDNEILIPKDISIPPNIKNSKLAMIKSSEKGLSIILNKNFDTPPEGLIISDFSFNIPFAIKSRIGNFYPLAVIFASFIIGAIIFKKRRYVKKYYPIIIIILVISAGCYLLIKLNTKYYVSQSEIDGLSILKRLPQGRVLVYDKDCLRCSFETLHKPAAAGGIKSYVKQLSNQDVFEDFSFTIASTSQEARKIIQDKNVNYIYLAKYEDYIEHLPYLPQDLGVSKLYENANVQIWKVD